MSFFLVFTGEQKKGNVANQREHLILILANMDVRASRSEGYESVSWQPLSFSVIVFVVLLPFCFICACLINGYFLQLSAHTIDQLKGVIFKNYELWCNFLHCKSNLK